MRWTTQAPLGIAENSNSSDDRGAQRQYKGESRQAPPAITSEVASASLKS